MGGYLGLPERLRSSESRVRRWSRRSGGSASTSTDTNDPPLELRTADSRWRLNFIECSACEGCSLSANLADAWPNRTGIISAYKQPASLPHQRVKQPGPGVSP